MNKHYKMSDLMRMQDRGVHKAPGPNGTLSRLFRQMVLDSKIPLGRIITLLQQYVEDPRNAVPNNRRDQISTRGNLIKEFARPHMTWKVFCKALRVFNISKAEIILRAHHHNGRVTEHSTIVKIGDRLTNGQFNSLLEQSEDEEAMDEVEVLDNLPSTQLELELNETNKTKLDTLVKEK